MKRKYGKLWGIAILLMLQMMLLIFIVQLNSETEVPTSEYLDSFAVEVATAENDFTCFIKWWQKENAQPRQRAAAHGGVPCRPQAGRITDASRRKSAACFKGEIP